MTLDEFDTWPVILICSQFVGAYSKSGISFPLNNAPRPIIAVKLELWCVEWTTETAHRTRALAYIDPRLRGNCLYGSKISPNTIIELFTKNMWRGPFDPLHVRGHRCRNVRKSGGQHRQWNDSGQRRVLRNASSAVQNCVERGGGWGQFPSLRCRRAELPRALLLHLPKLLHFHWPGESIQKCVWGEGTVKIIDPTQKSGEAMGPPPLPPGSYACVRGLWGRPRMRPPAMLAGAFWVVTGNRMLPCTYQYMLFSSTCKYWTDANVPKFE